MSREGPPARPGSNGSNPGGSVSETGSQNEALDDGAKQTIRDLVGMVNDLQARVDDLEDQVEQSNEQIADRVQHHIEDELDERFRDEQIERTKMLSNQKAGLMDKIDDVREELQSDIDGVHEELIGEQKTRTRADAQINSRISHLADETGATIDEEEIMLQDKLIRAIRNGAQDILADPNRRHERARDLLTMLSSWGSLQNDSNGKRVVVRATDVKDPMSERYDVTMSTTMVRRVFEAVEEWAEDSPRRVRSEKNNEGEWRLTVFQPNQLLAAAEEVSN